MAVQLKPIVAVADKKKRGRPPKAIAKKEAKAAMEGPKPRDRGIKAPLPQSDIDMISAATAASQIKDVEDCPVCAHPKRKQVEEDLYVIMSGGVTKAGHTELGQLTAQYQCKTVDLMRHRDKCMVKEAVLVLDKPKKGEVGTHEVENSAAWISKLSKYLTVVDGVIEREMEEDAPDQRLLLSAAESGRKICETNAKLFLDVYKLRIDKRVQDDFMRIVLDAVSECSPELRDKIMAKLKSRLAVANAAGVTGAI